VERGAYPAWKVGVLVMGSALLPFVFKEYRRKHYVSKWEAIREIKRQSDK